MVKVLGLVTEYNPFHNGHQYHVEKSRELSGCDYTVAVMSGHFLQRGEPAMFHKWMRGEMALQGGVDLVIEIPVPYSCSTAEFFAYGAIQLLNGTGVVTDLVFGSEAGSIENLRHIGRLLASPPASLEEKIRREVKEGRPYAVARRIALEDHHSATPGWEHLEELLSNPNNILGIEYMKALCTTGSSIRAHTLQRIQSHYHDRTIHGEIASATAIRHHIEEHQPFETLRNTVPEATYQRMLRGIDQGLGPVTIASFEQLLLGLLRRMTEEDLALVFDVEQGLEKRILESARKSTSVQELLTSVKSRRYTFTRLQRILMHVLLDLKKSDYALFQDQGGPQYLRILAFNEKGRELLKHMKKKAELPLITNLGKFTPQSEAQQRMIELDTRATRLYVLGMPEKNGLHPSCDFSFHPSIHTDRRES